MHSLQSMVIDPAVQWSSWRPSASGSSFHTVHAGLIDMDEGCAGNASQGKSLEFARLVGLEEFARLAALEFAWECVDEVQETHVSCDSRPA